MQFYGGIVHTDRYYGAEVPEVREWMLDSNNYVLDHDSFKSIRRYKVK